MFRKNKNLVTETEFAGLISGRLSRIYSMDSKCHISYERKNRLIIFEKNYGEQAYMSYDHTDLDRLNAHWIGFINS